MKSQTADTVALSVRCAHRSSGGRRCRLNVSNPRSVFCSQHLTEQREEEAADHYSDLSLNCQDFQTAQGINHALHNLYALLAQNRISPRRAAVLAHICGLLLRTLPQIDADQAAGIIDPTKPAPINVPAQVQHAGAGEDIEEHEDSVLDLVSDSRADKETQTETELQAHPRKKKS